jgi:hypothetical protein
MRDDIKVKTEGEPMLFVMEYVGGPRDDPDSFKLWVCRGERKGCKKRRMKTNRHCADCYLPDEDDTLEQIKSKMMRGDA